MRHLPILALLALAACGGRSAAPPGETLSPAQAECRAEARLDPEVTRLSREVNSHTPALSASRINEETRVAETRAFQRCLRARGLATPGGVEIIRPR